MLDPAKKFKTFHSGAKKGLWDPSSFYLLLRASQGKGLKADVACFPIFLVTEGSALISFSDEGDDARSKFATVEEQQQRSASQIWEMVI